MNPLQLCWFSLLVAVTSAKLVSHEIEYANVEIQKVARRSVLSPDSSYQVNIRSFGEKMQLNLEKPEYSVFAPGFQYLEASTNPATGEIQFTDNTPSEDEIASVERHFYTDPESQAAISLKHVDGAYKLNGRISDMSISSRGENIHEVSRKVKSDPQIRDYIDLNRKVTPGKSSRATSSATPEVFVVFDYDNSQLFKNNRTAILDYLGVFFHAVNNRYATSPDPVISFRISGVTTISARSAQPYMENNKVPSGTGYDINKVLPDFSKWLYNNSRSTPKYDMGALISGTDMQSQDSQGTWTSGVAGLAYVKGACWNYTQGGQYLGSSVNEDRGGIYDGAFTVAHEFAHNLGAPHDGDGDASSCPWSQGYLMSYEGWGNKTKFYFSECSKSIMKNFIDSSGGTCTKSQQSSTNIPVSSQNVGDRYSMQQLCVKYTNQANATVNPGDPNDLCKNLVCRYPTPNRPGYISIITMNHPPGDNSVCGNGGKCVDGDCVGQNASG